MKKYKLFLMALACLANLATTTTVNATCNLILYEPDMPEELMDAKE